MGTKRKNVDFNIIHSIMDWIIAKDVTNETIYYLFHRLQKLVKIIDKRNQNKIIKTFKIQDEVWFLDRNGNKKEGYLIVGSEKELGYLQVKIVTEDGKEQIWKVSPYFISKKGRNS